MSNSIIIISSKHLKSILGAGAALFLVAGTGCREDTKPAVVDAGTRDANVSSRPDTGGGTAAVDAAVAVDTAVAADTAVPDTASPDAASGDAPSVAAMPLEVIDDLEDCDSQIAAVNGRGSLWYVYKDPMSTLGPDPWEPLMSQGAPSSTMCSTHITGTIMPMGYGGVGIGLLSSNPSSPYDASVYGGVSFWLKGSGTVTFRVLTSTTVPPEGGGTCVQPGCYDGHAAVIELTPDWTQYSYTWDQLEQSGWGQPVAFDPKTALDLQWQPGVGAFDVSVDQISFIRTSASP